MIEISKPDISHIWASNGDVRAPTTTKTDQGWTSEIPPFQWENWAQNRQDQGLVHLFQKGISVWSATENYYFTSGGTKSYVQGSNGVIYSAVANSLNQNPVTDSSNTYWVVAFSSENGDFYSTSTGVANAYILTKTPARTTLVDGLQLRFKVVASNTGASTLKIDAVAVQPIIGLSLLPLQGGELFLNGTATVVWSATLTSWVLLNCTGGSLQVKNATQSQHAITYFQAQSLVSTARAAIYINAAASILPGTYFVDTTTSSFTLTLPASPNNGDAFTFIDANNTWAINNWNLDAGAKTFEGVASPLVVDLSNQQWSLLYNLTRWEFV